MKFETSKSARRRVLASSLGLLVSTLAMGPSTAAAADKVKCQVAAVEAEPEDDGSKGPRIPESLNFLKEQLSSPQFAAFKRFELLETKTLDLQLGKGPVSSAFRSGHRMDLELLSGEKKKLKLHAKLASGEKSLIDADYAIQSDGVILMPVFRSNQNDAVIFAIRCHG